MDSSAPSAPNAITERLASNMTRFRTHFLAVLGAGMLLTLSVSTAFAAHPENADADHPGQWVASFVHFQLFGSDGLAPSGHTDQVSDEQQSEETDQGDQQDDSQPDQPTSQATSATTDTATASSHGQCVKDIARGDGVGDPNNNHGGAVSAAARDTCWQTDTGGTSDPPTEVSDGPGNSSGTHGKQGGSQDGGSDPPTEVSDGPGNSSGTHGGGKP
jgi:hypothetical protein